MDLANQEVAVLIAVTPPPRPRKLEAVTPELVSTRISGVNIATDSLSPSSAGGHRGDSSGMDVADTQ